MVYIFDIDIDGIRYHAEAISDQYAVTVTARETRDEETESINCLDSIMVCYPSNVFDFDGKYVPFCAMITIMRLLATKKYIDQVLDGEAASLVRRDELLYAYCRAVKYFGRDYTIDKLRKFIKYLKFKSDRSILKFINTVLVASYYEWIYDYYFMSDQIHLIVKAYDNDGYTGDSYDMDLSKYLYCDPSPAKKRNPELYKQHYIEYRIAMLKLFTTYKRINNEMSFKRITSLISSKLPVINGRIYFNELF